MFPIDSNDKFNITLIRISRRFVGAVFEKIDQVT